MDNIQIPDSDDGNSSTAQGSDDLEPEFAPEVVVVIKENDSVIYDDQDPIKTNENDLEQYAGFGFGYPLHFLEDYEDNNDLEDCYADEETVTAIVKRTKRKNKDCVPKKICDEFTQAWCKLKGLQYHSYVRIICPCCDQENKSFAMWVRHVKVRHIDFTEQVKCNYNFKTTHRAICKHCQQTLNFYVSHFLHYLTYHSPDIYKLFLCHLCNYRDKSLDSIVKHIDESHKHDDLYRMCPLCDIMFLDGKLMVQHLMNKHNSEFKTKFGYICHLCNHPKFLKETHYFDHLMNVHRLYGHDWENLNFKKLVEDEKLLVECIKCFETCVNTGAHTLLEHYLTHEESCFWSCTYCDSIFHYKEPMHLCKQMYKFLNRNNISVNICPPPIHHKSSPVKAIKQLDEWKEFEAYIIHLCPFCNDKFNDFQQWQLHLRQQHYINTLEGLQMSIVNDLEKFRCLQCDALITKSSVDLHTHRFKHLPYMPYKCRHCFKFLENENMARKHVLNQCKDENIKSTSIDMKQCDIPIGPKLVDDDNNWIEILCVLCNNKQFSSTADIESHFRTHHNNFAVNYCKSGNNLDMVCKECKTTIRSVSSDICLTHYVKHLKEGPYKCLHCRRSYTSFKICRRHVRRFHMAAARQRKASNITAAQQTKIKRLDGFPAKINTKVKGSELKFTTPENTKLSSNGICTSSDKAIILNEFQEFFTYACAECNASFDEQKLWSDHVKTQHTFFNDDELSEISIVDGKHRCKLCNLVLDTSPSYRQKHKLTHMPYKSFVCSLCTTRCNTLAPLYSHLRGIHFSKGNFECPICLVNLTTSYERSEHVKQMHPRSEWPVNMCLICYRKYASLRTHMLSHDMNRPKYVCHLCDATLVIRKEYKLHMERKHNIKVDNDVKRIAPTTRNYVGEVTEPVVKDVTESSDKRRSQRKTVARKKEEQNSKIAKPLPVANGGKKTAETELNELTEVITRKRSQFKPVITNKNHKICRDDKLNASDCNESFKMVVNEVAESTKKRKLLRKTTDTSNKQKIPKICNNLKSITAMHKEMTETCNKRRSLRNKDTTNNQKK